MTFKEKLASGKFLVTSEIGPPENKIEKLFEHRYSQMTHRWSQI